MAGASYVFQEHLIDRQAKAEEELLKELRSGSYTIHNPIVRTNFYFIAPLTAVIAFNTEEETAVTVTVFGKTKEANISHTFPKEKEHVLPIMGLYPEYTNKVEIREYRGESHVVEIEMGKPDCGNGFIYSMDTTPESVSYTHLRFRHLKRQLQTVRKMILPCICTAWFPMAAYTATLPTSMAC